MFEAFDQVNSKISEDIETYLEVVEPEKVDKRVVVSDELKR